MNGLPFNIWTEQNTYKTAKCKACEKKLIEKDLIVSIAHVNGGYTAISNYHPSCAEPFLTKFAEHIGNLLNKLNEVTLTIEKNKIIDNCFNEAKQNFASTLENLGNE